MRNLFKYFITRHAFRLFLHYLSSIMHHLISSHLIKLLVGHVGGEHVLNLNRDLGVGPHDTAVLELDLDF